MEQIIQAFSAIGVISEIGVDMSVFPTSKHLCSWAGLSVHSGLNLLNRSLDIFCEIRGHVKGFTAFQQAGRDSGGRLAYGEILDSHLQHSGGFLYHCSGPP